MSRLEKHLAKWREDVQADIDTLRADLDELLGVLAWLDEQAGVAVAPPEPEREPEPPAEAPPAPTEAPAPEAPRHPRRGAYVRTTPEQLRDIVRQNGPCTAREVAEVTGASESSVRPKLDAWVEKGTMLKEGILVDGARVHIYKIAGVEHPPYRSVRKPPRLTVVTKGTAAVARTGRRNVKVMKRAGKIKGVKGQ